MRLALVILWTLAAAACGGETAPALPEGDAERGRQLLRQFACGSCHAIPGVAEADGNVGPPLGGVARRAYIAGVLPNTPQNMAAFIRDPQSADPRTAMPAMGVTEDQARDMTTYLHTLR
jgi:cytochrome c2